MECQFDPTFASAMMDGKGEHVTCLFASMGVDMATARMLLHVSASQDGSAQTLLNSVTLEGAQRQVLCAKRACRLSHSRALLVLTVTTCRLQTISAIGVSLNTLTVGNAMKTSV